jgi:hypothetical protein
MIEAAIVDRPVHTILADEYEATQRGTLHFHYLVDPEFGHVRVADSFDENIVQLERSIVRGDAEGLNGGSCRRFVRPHGLDVAATPLRRGDRGARRRSGADAAALSDRRPIRPPCAGPGRGFDQAEASTTQAAAAGYCRFINRRSLSSGASGRRRRSSFASASYVLGPPLVRFARALRTFALALPRYGGAPRHPSS